MAHADVVVNLIRECQNSGGARRQSDCTSRIRGSLLRARGRPHRRAFEHVANLPRCSRPTQETTIRKVHSVAHTDATWQHAFTCSGPTHRCAFVVNTDQSNSSTNRSIHATRQAASQNHALLGCATLEFLSHQSKCHGTFGSGVFGTRRRPNFGAVCPTDCPPIWVFCWRFYSPDEDSIQHSGLSCFPRRRATVR